MQRAFGEGLECLGQGQELVVTCRKTLVRARGSFAPGENSKGRAGDDCQELVVRTPRGGLDPGIKDPDVLALWAGCSRSAAGIGRMRERPTSCGQVRLSDWTAPLTLPRPSAPSRKTCSTSPLARTRARASSSARYLNETTSGVVTRSGRGGGVEKWVIRED